LTFQESTPDAAMTAMLAGLLRHVLTLLAGLGIGVGSYSDSTLMIIAGALVGIATAVWSIYQKILAARAADAAAVRSADTGKPQLVEGVSNAKI
jgi:F0F1-type ATP synthase membrane subunit c/vacuolar-type H+-ATPase subunit K